MLRGMSSARAGSGPAQQSLRAQLRSGYPIPPPLASPGVSVRPLPPEPAAKSGLTWKANMPGVDTLHRFTV